MNESLMMRNNRNENQNFDNQTYDNQTILNQTFENFTYQEKLDHCVLYDINLSIKKGEFVGVFGEVSSGKSSLLHAIMNNLLLVESISDIDNEEIKNDKGHKIIINGEVSYTSQIPWVKNETIRNNIIFFNEFDEQRYQDTLRYSQLLDDLEKLPGKDQTEIGEKATNLSGGQRARISLARAIYVCKSIYLFDDPLAALDKNVADKVFFECFQNYLAKSTRILATQNLKYLPYFDRIIWLNRGEIIFNGKFSQLLQEEFFRDFSQEILLIQSSQKQTNAASNDGDLNSQECNKYGNQSSSDISTKDSLLITGQYKIVENENFEEEKEIKDVKNIFNRRRSLIAKLYNESNHDTEKDKENIKLIPNASRRKSVLSIKFMIPSENKTNSKRETNKDLIKKKSCKSIKFVDQEKENNEYNKNLVEEEKAQIKIVDPAEKNVNNTISHKLIVDEDREIGEIKHEIFIKYFYYMGGIKLFFFVFSTMLLWQAFNILSNFSLADWTREIKGETNNSNWIYFLKYSTLSLLGCLCIFLQPWMLSRGSIESAKALHKDIICSLIKAPINLFYDITTKGPLLNRLSRELEGVFYSMFNLGYFLVCFFTCFGCIFVVAFYQYYLLILVPILVKLGMIVYSYFINTNMDLRRLEGVSRSKIVNAISETIDGLVQIRVFDKQNDYKNKFYTIIDDNMKINIFINGCFGWFIMYMGLMILFFFVILLILIILFQNSFDSQAIALVLIYCSKLQSNIINIFLSFIDFKNDMISMERCLKLTDIPQENSYIVEKDEYLIDNNKKKNSSIENKDKNQAYGIKAKLWPEKGQVDFLNYSVKYRPDCNFVLNKMTITLLPGEKIGIIGRTGCGKSTICNALFRILEPAGGTILIDGEDIAKIGLSKLRRNITIIPQEPCIFKGSLRYNIDPLNVFCDSEIENVLKMIGYNYANEEEGIYKEIGEGNVLSIGEKQLISICRAILRVNINTIR